MANKLPCMNLGRQGMKDLFSGARLKAFRTLMMIILMCQHFANVRNVWKIFFTSG